MLSVEVMDTPFINSISKWRDIARHVNSPWFTVYPDLGNLSAWGNDVAAELALGIGSITAVHLKDTVAVGPGSAGQFRDVPFGEGCVDFAHAFSVLNALGYRGPCWRCGRAKTGRISNASPRPRPGSNNR